MLYVQQSLGADEELVQIGHFHWMHTVQAFLAIFWGMLGSLIVLIGATMFYKQMGYFPDRLPFAEGIVYLHPAIRIFAFIVFTFGLLSFAQNMIEKATTEMAVTNNRLIYKRGLVARQVGEISIDRVEGVNVRQGILGRILGYGQIAVRGMGVGEVLLPDIMDDPIAFRQSIEKARAM